MRPKSGLPKRKAIRSEPKFDFGFRDNPQTAPTLNPSLKSAGRKSNAAVQAVSLFAGCGGLDLGILGGFHFLDTLYPSLPFEIVGAYDNDPRAVETYRLNIADHAHLRDLTATPMSSLPGCDVLFGGFPCQDFSSCGHKRGFEGERGQLYKVMIDYMRAHRPKVVVGENVPLLAGMKGGSLLDRIVSDLEGVGYKVRCWFINCTDFGLPASRRRIFIVCVRDDLPGFPSQPAPTHVMRPVFIDDALDDLMAVTDEAVPNQSQYFVATKATAGAGQGDQTSVRGRFGFAVRANAKARIHFHYELDRRLTVRECARLQSFPDEFVFPYAAGPNVILIGNAVPPIVAHNVGREIARYVMGLREAAEPLRRAS